MQKKKPSVDIILDVLKTARSAYPDSEFIRSLLFQYEERGGLSKKQLEGLYGKAAKIDGIAAGKLATLEAIILKKPTRYKSALPSALSPAEKDTLSVETVNAILEKYPQHKRVLFYKTKINGNESLSPAEKAELQKFKKILLK